MQDRWQYRWKDYGFCCVDTRFIPASWFKAAADTKTQTTKRGGAQLDHIQQVD